MILTLKYINMHKSIKIYFDNYLKFIFKDKYEIQITDNNNCDICICSVFGELKNIDKINAKLKIFFTGENLSFIHRKKEYNIHEINRKFHIIIGFSPTNLKYNLIRFPIWLLCYPFYSMPNNENNIIDYIKNRRKINMLENKKYIASCIASHSRLGIRKKICNEFSNYNKIIYPGKFRKNFNIGASFDDKINFLKKVKFNICPENSKSNGYCTEKIFHALEAGCVPIYWGNDLPEKNIINENCYTFINIQNKDEMKKKIKYSIDNYNKILEQKIFKDNAKEIVKKYYNDLEFAIKKFIK